MFHEAASPLSVGLATINKPGLAEIRDTNLWAGHLQATSGGSGTAATLRSEIIRVLVYFSSQLNCVNNRRCFIPIPLGKTKMGQWSNSTQRPWHYRRQFSGSNGGPTCLKFRPRTSGTPVANLILNLKPEPCSQAGARRVIKIRRYPGSTELLSGRQSCQCHQYFPIGTYTVDYTAVGQNDGKSFSHATAMI
ncbi:hypothetical protein BDW66DRAFT_112738 [Aspergillus desertorum]